MKNGSRTIRTTPTIPSVNSPIPAGEQDPGRYRALADPTRRRLLELLRRSETPLSAPELAGVVGLHESTVRSHLGILAESELVRSHLEDRHRRGRPRRLYVAAPADELETGLVAATLAQALAQAPGAIALVEQAGRDQGRSLARARPPGASAAGALVELLDRSGFSAQIVDDGRILMRRCPLRALADAEPAIVCGLHRGVVAGFLEGVDAAVRLVEFEARTAPEPCVLRLDGSPR